MPQAITALVATFGLSAAATAIVASIITIGLTVGLSALVNSIFGPGSPRPSDGQQIVRQSVGSRRRHYGIVHTGGTLSFEESSNGTIGLVVTLGTGEESDILQHRINDKVVTVSGSGTVTNSSFHGALHIYTRSGTSDQTAIAELTAKFSQWTSAHRQRGCAHAAIIGDPVDQNLFSEVYNSQVPQYTQVRKAAKIYDPRKDSTAGGSGSQRLTDRSTWAWSDNWALVIADYFAHPDGYGAGYDAVNWANIAVEADICDQTVTTVTGETIARWRLWASYSLASDERRQVLANMMKAGDGFCWQDADCRFNLMVGRYQAPTVTLTDDHILTMAATLGPKAQYRTNAVKALYTEAAIGYREQESATVAATDMAVDPNTDPQTLEVYFAPHHNQAVRLAKITLARLGERWHITATLNLFGLNLLGQRFCRLESTSLGVSADFIIDGPLRLNMAAQTVEATLTEVHAADWDFDAATEEGTPPLAPDGSGTVITIAVPTGLTLSAVQIALNGSTGVAIAATWSAGRPGLTYQVRYRPTAGGDWTMMMVDNTARTARSGAVDTNTQYEVQIRALTLSYWVSAWSSSQTITPVATTTLAAPSALTATGSAGAASIAFRMPTGASLAYARLYRSTGAFGTAVQVGADIVGALGQMISEADTGLSAGTYNYWAQAFDSSGGSSALAGPVAATVS